MNYFVVYIHKERELVASCVHKYSDYCVNFIFNSKLYIRSVNTNRLFYDTVNNVRNRKYNHSYVSWLSRKIFR